MPQSDRRPYQVTQSGRAEPGTFVPNAAVDDLESLYTHHPKRNYHAALVEGLPKNAENTTTRGYAVVGGEFQEVMVARVDKYRSLEPDQVLLIKDFILDDMTAANTRRVDVPAPTAGVVGRVDAPNGVVDICDPADGRLVARIRHLGPIAVESGENVAYGQSLGTQSNLGLGRTAGKHVHIEMDTRYHQQFDHYMLDLVEGRLPVQAVHRAGVEPRPVDDDGIQRVGEAGARVAAVQRALVAGGYRAVHDAAIPVDGVYRLSMQGAVLKFQHDNGLDPSGDIDAPTWRRALDLTLGRPLLPPPVVDGLPGVHSNTQDRLLDRLRGRVSVLDAVNGHPLTDDQRERMAHSLTALAAGQRLQSVDHVLFGAAPGVAAGERVFVIQGRLDDPAQRRAWMPAIEAINTPVVDSQARLQGLREREQSSALQPDLSAHYHQPESALTSLRHGQPA